MPENALYNLVDRRGIEPRPMPCKGIVLPLSLSAQIFTHSFLRCDLCNVTGIPDSWNLVLTTGFEPATGFLLRITKPVLSAIQPSQRNWSLCEDLNLRRSAPNGPCYQTTLQRDYLKIFLYKASLRFYIYYEHTDDV